MTMNRVTRSADPSIWACTWICPMGKVYAESQANCVCFASIHPLGRTFRGDQPIADPPIGRQSNDR